MVDLFFWQQETFKRWTLTSAKSRLTVSFHVEKKFEVTFGIFLVLVTQINVLAWESFKYLSVLKLVLIKTVKIVMT